VSVGRLEIVNLTVLDVQAIAEIRNTASTIADRVEAPALNFPKSFANKNPSYTIEAMADKVQGVVWWML
jgi:hypothetical protein